MSDDKYRYRIINTYDQLKVAVSEGAVNKQQAVAVSYNPIQKIGFTRCAEWEIFSPYFKTDPEAHWTDYGKKKFTVTHRGEKKTVLAEAMQWASEKYGVQEWAKNRAGDYVPKEIEARFPIPKERKEVCDE